MSHADIIKYAALIQNERGEILLGKKHGKDTWINIGGRVEEGESPIECLRREIKEELNCEVDIDADSVPAVQSPATPALDDPNKTVKIIWYKVKLLGTPNPSNEIEEVMWMRPEDHDKYKLAPQIEEYLIPALLGTHEAMVVPLDGL